MRKRIGFPGRAIALVVAAATLAVTTSGCSATTAEPAVSATPSRASAVLLTFDLVNLLPSSLDDPSRREHVEIVAHIDGESLKGVETRRATAGTKVASSVTKLTSAGLTSLEFEDCSSETYRPPPGGETLHALISDTLGSWGDPAAFGFVMDGQWWVRKDDDLIYRQKDQSSDLEMTNVRTGKLVTKISNRTFRTSVDRGGAEFTIDLPQKCS